MNLLFLFVLLYPITMAIFWVIGSVFHYFIYERKVKKTMYKTPKVSILVPCYNEEANLEEIMYRLDNLNYPDYEIVAIDDGSSDLTLQKLRALNKVYDRLKVVRSIKNKGKANALHLGLLASNGEIIVGVDADAYIDKDALNYLVRHFLYENSGNNIGAVTGNPRVRNRRNLLSKIQMGEFSSIVGMIKRTQSMNNTVMTVSGVIVAFRRTAMLDVNLWDKDMITEDIAVTWKLHGKKWRVVYEPKAVCWMLVPEKLPGLWKQRYRWSQGGIEVLYRHLLKTILGGDIRNLFLLFEQIIGILWAYSWLVLFTIRIIMTINGTYYPDEFQQSFLIFICILQFTFALLIERKYDEKFLRYYLWIIWYPIVYWYFNAIIVIKAFFQTTIKQIFRKNKEFATWTSPDRGDKKNVQVDINLNIANEVNLNKNLTNSKENKTVLIISLVVSILLWANMISRYIKFGQNISNISSLQKTSIGITLLTFDYGMYFQYFAFVVFVSILIMVFLALFSYFPMEEKHFKKYDTKKMESDYFKISIEKITSIKREKYYEF